MGCRKTMLLNIFFGLVLHLSSAQENKGPITVVCSRDEMRIIVPDGGDIESVELQKWSIIPGCSFTPVSVAEIPIHDPHTPIARGSLPGSHTNHVDKEVPSAGAYIPEEGGLFHMIVLSLSDDLPCGTTRVRNTHTGKSVYYQRLLINTAEGLQESLMAKCSPPTDESHHTHNIVRRDLPPGFVEPDYIEITSEVTGTAPVPILGVGVRQDGSLVEGAINVQPGTPLTMEVYLDDKSSDTYGILVSFLEVTDNGNKDETIVYNGCTIDPNLFENFVTFGGKESGDFLAAKFRAFKFPESNYVLFRGTVDVCLDKCQGITCSDGKIGFGRRRRNIDASGPDPNKIFEVTMTTYILFSENSTKSDQPEIIAEEERIRERISYRPLNTWEDEVPLIRRSPDVPPSIAFSGGLMIPISQILISVLALVVSRILS